MKKLFIGLIIIAVILGSIFFYLRYNKLKDFEPQIKQKLDKLVSQASHGLYHLEIEQLQTDVISSKIILINAHLRPDTIVYAALEKLQQAPNDLFDVTVSHLSIDDIVPGDFLANKTINLGRLFINKPVIKVVHKKQPYNLPDAEAAKSVFEQIKKDISSIKIDTIILNNIDFIYTNRNRNNNETKLLNVKLVFSDILVDSASQFDRRRFLFASNCLISMRDHSINTSDSLYRLSVGEMDIQTRNHSLQLKNLQFAPRLSVRNFYRRLKHQQDRFELTLEELSAEMDWWAILADESFSANKVIIKNGKIKVYNDKSQPIDTRSKVGKYPHQLLMKLPFLLKVDTIAINDLDVSYTELNPKSQKTGTLFFSNVHSTITNITNDPEAILNNSILKISAKAVFMKQAPISASFAFDLVNHKKGSFSVTATVNNLHSTALSDITIPLALMKVNSVHIKNLDVSIRGDNNQATGTVKMIYNDLNITALKTAGDTMQKRGLLSFIANTFIIKKHNPLNGQPVRVEKATFLRDPKKSFFNLVWKTIFTGAGKTVGYNKKK